MREPTSKRIAHGGTYGLGRVELRLAERELHATRRMVCKGREPADPTRCETRKVTVGSASHVDRTRLGARGADETGDLLGHLVDRNLDALARGTVLELAATVLDGSLAKD